jgi:uncharacterized protein DUF4446
VASLLLSGFLLLRMRRAGASATARRLSWDPGRDDSERLAAIGSQLDALVRRVDVAEIQSQRAIQRIGVVRYNPFEDTGSNQSFALAVLDARGDGFVLLSMHSRQQTRVFLKPVAAGRTETAVSEEEAEAIRRASASQGNRSGN